MCGGALKVREVQIFEWMRTSFLGSEDFQSYLLDLKISNRISVSFTDLYVPCGIDKGPHTEKLVKRYWPKSDFKQYLCKVHMFTKGKKIADPVFTDSHS